MTVKALLLHLRLGFNLILMPIFLWGFWLSRGPIGPKFWLGLCVFHILFYGGSVAYNSYYDQDDGPIGGLWNPPRPTRALLIFSLAIQALGMGLIFLVNIPLVAVSLVMFALSTAYSHPAVRLKARPWASLLTVSLGQGIGGAVAGWLCGQNDPRTLLSWEAGLGVLTSSFVTTGFYPLTQIYQRQEDRSRGDNTFAVVWGAKVFPFAMACLGGAALTGGLLLWERAGALPAVLLIAALAGLVGIVFWWWRDFDEGQVRRNYLYVMRIGYVMAIGFVVFIGWQLAQHL